LIPVPAAPDYVLGLINWRNRPIPLIDLALRLKMTSKGTGSANGTARLLVVRDKVDGFAPPDPARGTSGEDSRKKGLGQAALAGLLIRPVIQLVRLPTEHQRCVRELPLDPRMIRAAVELESETVVVPDIGEILGRTP
jgi:chemotaxis signal transduction protein